MIDIHTHILPGIDDGSENGEQSLKMLGEQVKQGVDRLFLTPHFDLDSMSLDRFLSRREAAFSLLKEKVRDRVVPDMKLGAEVRFTPELLELDLSRLTLGNSDYLLLELPAVTYPTMLEQSVEQMLDRGIYPILAHVERCRYFYVRPDALTSLIEQGAVAQITADVLLQRRAFSFARVCLSHDLAHLIASDTHNTATRPPCLRQARACVPARQWERTQAFAQAVWKNADLPVMRPRCPSPFRYKHV